MSHAAWCQATWDMLAEGGVWGIPRSGITFVKRGGKLVLISRMPHMNAMPITAEQLREQQDGDFEATREEFAKIGVEVVNEIPEHDDA